LVLELSLKAIHYTSAASNLVSRCITLGSGIFFMVVGTLELKIQDVHQNHKIRGRGYSGDGKRPWNVLTTNLKSQITLVVVSINHLRSPLLVFFHFHWLELPPILAFRSLTKLVHQILQRIQL
jgi:hypothetical protein